MKPNLLALRIYGSGFVIVPLHNKPISIDFSIKPFAINVLAVFVIKVFMALRKVAIIKSINASFNSTKAFAESILPFADLSPN